ncbi:MAG: 4-alpha-glucanotransferase [Elusimicrobia bacterium]|nr:4-alpha-glucanotransferase [Elusimicrobiota bacterium]
MPTLNDRSAGVLLHPTSLPGPYGVGDLGPQAHDFLDFLAEAGQSWWQMLPVVPPGAGNSPYNSLSAFAGSAILVSLDRLAEEGLLSPKALKSAVRSKPGSVDFAAAERFKHDRLLEAFQAFEASADAGAQGALARFCADNEDWLGDYALFRALRHERGNAGWWEWDRPARLRQPEALEEARRRLERRVRFERFVQWRFDLDWKRLAAAGRARGIGLIGDIPIFVSLDSAEVWAHPELFWLDEEGRALKVAGVPPDYFAKDGQLWGNPLYRWDAMRQRGYRWWLARLKAAFDRFDAARLDHFIGFHNYWEIPGGAKTAREGRWVPGPGAEFFDQVFAALGRVQLIAEDLGVVTEGVKNLRDGFQLPGMKVLQFAFGADPEARNYQPHRYPRRCVAYTGTHDNDTTAGWWRDRGGSSTTRSPEQIKRERSFAALYLGSDGAEIHWDMIRAALASVADIAIVPAQDLLGLGSEARMNRPGTCEGNWGWRLSRPLGAAVARRLGALTDAYERAARRPG